MPQVYRVIFKYNKVKDSVFWSVQVAKITVYEYIFILPLRKIINHMN